MRSFEARIYVGFKEFTNKERTKFIEHSLEKCEDICQDFCDMVGLCVTVTPTKYIYTNGNENGAIIGLIQYPRFETPESILKENSLTLARTLQILLGQLKVTINFPDEVIMLSND